MHSNGRSRGRGRAPDLGGFDVDFDADDGSADGDPPQVSSATTDADELRPADDDLFEVLYNQRRRQVLEYLRDGDGEATAGELAEHIAAQENDITVKQLSSYERKRVYVSLYQNHLGVMDDAGVVDYDADRKTVSLRAEATALDPYLEDAPQWERPWLAVVAAGTVAPVVLLGSLQIGALATVPAAAWIVLGVVCLVGMASLDRVERALS